MDFPPPDTTFTEYVFIETVLNSSGVTWSDYHMQLGPSPGDGPFPFVADKFSVATVLSDGLAGLALSRRPRS